MHQEKLRGILGLAMRAGKVVSGSNMVFERMAKDGKLLLLSHDAQGGTARQLVAKAHRQGLLVYRLPLEKDELGLIIGKGSRSALLIIEQGFAESINRLLLEMEVRPCEQNTSI